MTVVMPPKKPLAFYGNDFRPFEAQLWNDPGHGATPPSYRGGRSMPWGMTREVPSCRTPSGLSGNFPDAHDRHSCRTNSPQERSSAAPRTHAHDAANAQPMRGRHVSGAPFRR